MSDRVLSSGDELFFAIRAHGSLDVVVTARGSDEDQVMAEHARAMTRRPRSERGRFYCGSFSAGLCEAAFAAVVLNVVGAMDLNLDGQVAGEYRIAA